MPGFRVGIGFSGRDPGIPGIQFFNEFTRPCSRFEQNSDKMDKVCRDAKDVGTLKEQEMALFI